MVTIRLGLETVDPQEGERDGGKVDEASFGRAVGELLAAGFAARDVAAYVLVGRPLAPGETAQHRLATQRATVSYAHSLGIQVRVAEFSPVPGTAEWQAAVAAGSVAGDADPLLHNKALYPCADGVSLEELKRQARSGNQALLH